MNQQNKLYKGIIILRLSRQLQIIEEQLDHGCYNCDVDVNLHPQPHAENVTAGCFLATTDPFLQDVVVNSKKTVILAVIVLTLTVLLSALCLVAAHGILKARVSCPMRMECMKMEEKDFVCAKNGESIQDSSLQDVKEPGSDRGPEDKGGGSHDDEEDFPFSLFTGVTRFRPALPQLLVFPARRRDQQQRQGSGGPGEARSESSRQQQHQQQQQQQEQLQQQSSAAQQWPPTNIHGVPWSTFRHELHRLGTFSSLTSSLPLSALKLAQAGFLCLPGGTAIVCYFCGLRRDTWRAGESPMAVHRQLSENCPMLAGQHHENQPAGSVPEESLQQLMSAWSMSGPPLLPVHSGEGERGAAEMADARAAVAHPSQILAPGKASTHTRHAVGSQTRDLAEDSASPVVLTGAHAAQASGVSQASPTALASPSHARTGGNGTASGAHLAPQNSGTSNSNREQAGGQPRPPRMGLMGGSAASANPGAPAPILDGTAQPQPTHSRTEVPARTDDAEGRSGGQQVVTYQQLGIVTDSPKRPDMAMVNARLSSFRSWPSGHSHTPLQLSEAGFFYAGYADCGRCFFCGGGLKNWDPPDNPWVEHARWFPRCAYVRQCQGQDFIDVVQELNDDRRAISLSQVMETINQRRADGERIQEPVVDPAISSVLELGVTQASVDQAVDRLQREGTMLTADRLLDCLQTDGPIATGGARTSLPLSDDSGEVSELVTENNEMRQQRMCKICLDKESCIVFLPCGHLVSCPECSPALKYCPMCRQRVKGRVRAFPA